MLKGSEILETVDTTALRTFAESLKCPEEYCAEGRQLVDKVREKIAKETVFYVAESRFGGSVGKSTDVIAPDFDIVVAVNEVAPPFKSVLEDFHRILVCHEEELKIQPGSLRWDWQWKLPSRSLLLQEHEVILRFSFVNGIGVVLVPTCNVPVEEVRRKMLNKSKSRSTSSSLAEESVAFMEAQDSFTHNIVRLGKLWFKSCYFGGQYYIHGGNTMIELIAVAASVKELEMGERSELRALTRVIEMVQNIDNVKIAFKKNTDGKWELIPENISNREVAFGEWGIFKWAILTRKYYILFEPANPNNDLLQDTVRIPNFIEKIKKFAGVTGRRLDELRMEKNAAKDLKDKDNAADTNFQFEKLFEPQPSNLKEEFPSGVPSDVSLSLEDSYPSIYPDLKIVKKRVLDKLGVKAFLDVFKWNVMLAAKASQTGVFSKETVYSSVKNQIEASLQVKVSPIVLHEAVDVSVWVPFRVQGGIHAVRIDLIWK